MKASILQEDGRKTVLVVEDNPDDMILLQTAAQETCPDIRFSRGPVEGAGLLTLNPRRKRRRRFALPAHSTKS